jgi:hypothetical protein
MTMTSGKGDDCNRVNIGGVTKLHGDPKKKAEKGHTIILFPGGSVEVSRTSDNQYWVHVAIEKDGTAQIVNARIDACDDYLIPANKALKTSLETARVEHVAFLVKPC